MAAAYLNPSPSPGSISVAAANSSQTGTLNLTSIAGALTLTVTTNPPAQLWTASVFYPVPSSEWLRIYPTSGSGSGFLTVQPASGLAAGTYNATLFLQSLDASPQVIAIPVTYTAGLGQ
jgi:hypothetical protein